MPHLAELLALSNIFGFEGVANTAAAFRSLSLDEGRALAVEFVASDPDEEDLGEFLHRLAAFVPGSLIDVQSSLAENGILYPGFLYHGAPRAVGQQLIAELDKPNADVNGLLKALAWIGDDSVVERFAAWTKNPPAWSDELSGKIDIYTLEGGWTLTRGGHRRDLYHQVCRPLASYKDQKPTVDIQSTRQDRCAWCGHNLIDLMGIDLKASELEFLGLEGHRLNIGCCIRCSAFTSVFTDIDFDGRSVWRADNQKPKYNGPDGEEWEYETLKWSIGPPRRSPFEAHPNLMYRGGSQLGGTPSWEQHAEYPKCPQCAEYMTFIGQVAGSDVAEYSEGYTYAFLCVDCKTASTVYQQT